MLNAPQREDSAAQYRKHELPLFADHPRFNPFLTLARLKNILAAENSRMLRQENNVLVPLFISVQSKHPSKVQL
jgi:hypothetical protein